MIKRLLIGLLLGLLTVACTADAIEPARGLGGTGHSLDRAGSGIGGTGYAADQRASGIGGTGYQPSGDGRGIGGTGIVGTIRGFGSIWVNGVEVHYWEDQSVSIYERAGTSKDLRVGQVVAVEAEPQAARLVARSIEVRHAVVGPVASIDRRAGTMQVLGQTVRLPSADPLSAALRPGDWVSVSGLRDPKGVVISTLLERTPKGVGAFVRGAAEQGDGTGIVIGGHRYPLPAGAGPATIPRGADLTLYGEPEGDGLLGTRLQLGWVLPFDGRVRNFLLEGFVGADGRRVGALVLPDSAYRPKPGERVVVQGRFDLEGRLEQQSLRVLSAPSGLDRLRIPLEDLDGRPRTSRPPAWRGSTLEGTRSLGADRPRALGGDRPVGLAPSAPSSQTPGWGVPPEIPWGQGSMNYDPYDNWGPSVFGGARGFPSAPSFGAPGTSGGKGGAGGATPSAPARSGKH